MAGWRASTSPATATCSSGTRRPAPDRAPGNGPPSVTTAATRVTTADDPYHAVHAWGGDVMPEAESRADSILPSAEEAAELVPGPDSVTWRISGDARILTTAGYALVLQVAHPTVGAGVAEHSNFREDPWGRLFRTLDYTTIMVYGGAELAAQTG